MGEEEEDVVFEGSGIWEHLREFNEDLTLSMDFEKRNVSSAHANVTCDKDFDRPRSRNVLNLLQLISRSSSVLREDVSFVQSQLEEEIKLFSASSSSSLGRFPLPSYFRQALNLSACVLASVLPSEISVALLAVSLVCIQSKTRTEQTVKRALHRGEVAFSVGKKVLSFLQESELVEQGFSLFLPSVSCESSVRPLLALFSASLAKWRRNVYDSHLALITSFPLPIGMESSAAELIACEDDEPVSIDDDLRLVDAKREFAEFRSALSAFWRRYCLFLIFQNSEEETVPLCFDDWDLMAETTTVLKKALNYHRQQAFCLEPDPSTTLRSMNSSLQERALLDCRVHLRVALQILCSTVGTKDEEGILQECETQIMVALDSIRLWHREIHQRTPQVDASIARESSFLVCPLEQALDISPINVLSAGERCLEVEDDLYEGKCEDFAKQKFESSPGQGAENVMETGAVLRELKCLLKGNVVPQRRARERAIRQRKGLQVVEEDDAEDVPLAEDSREEVASEIKEPVGNTSACSLDNVITTPPPPPPPPPLPIANTTPVALPRLSKGTNMKEREAKGTSSSSIAAEAALVAMNFRKGRELEVTFADDEDSDDSLTAEGV